MIVRYDFVCKHGHVFDEVRQSGDTKATQCKCGCMAYWKPSFQAQPQFKPFDHPDLDPSGPVRIESREQYARECERRDLNGPYNRTSEAPRRTARQGESRALRKARLEARRKA
jgi:hypothetical protein